MKIICPLCSKAFWYANRVVNHLIKMHGINQEELQEMFDKLPLVIIELGGNIELHSLKVDLG